MKIKCDVGSHTEFQMRKGETRKNLLVEKSSEIQFKFVV